VKRKWETLQATEWEADTGKQKKGRERSQERVWRAGRGVSESRLCGDPPGVAAGVFDTAAEVGVAWFVDGLLN
jgi:hypothetical protein